MIRFAIAFLMLLTNGFLVNHISAQSSSDSAEAIPFIKFNYSYLFPGGDFEETFGNTNTVGGALGFKSQSNWQVELEGNYFFGTSNKRANLLDDIINDAGDVIDSDGELVRVVLDIRAVTVFGTIGKVIPLGSNTNSGLLLQVGIGFMQHRIKVDYREGTVFQFNEEMLKGYDRLHNGIATKQFIGYQFFGKKNLTNFYIGLEFIQGHTKNRREYNYDTREFDLDRKLDLLNGFRVGWTIPIRSRSSDNFYYY